MLNPRMGRRIELPQPVPTSHVPRTGAGSENQVSQRKVTGAYPISGLNFFLFGRRDSPPAVLRDGRAAWTARSILPFGGTERAVNQGDAIPLGTVHSAVLPVT